MTLLTLLFVVVAIVLLIYVLPLTGIPTLFQRVLWGIVAVILVLWIVEMVFPGALGMRIGGR